MRIYSEHPGSCIEPDGMDLANETFTVECDACGSDVQRRVWQEVEGGSVNNYSETNCEQCKAELADIAEQNDLFRKALMDPIAAQDMQKRDIQGRVFFAQGAAAESEVFTNAALNAVATFDTFNEENDPYGDHTFGVVEVLGQKVFWKIDLYDLDFKYGSEQPNVPMLTQRVLTIMLPSDY